MQTYNNPVIPGFYPDPSICRVGEDFYLVTSTFEYFPGVPVFHSRDLVHWRQIGHCLTRESQLPLDKAGNSGGIYAPTIRHHDGWFYMTTTNVSGGGHFVVRTQDPAGPWSEPAWVDQGGIDPSLLFDDDGRVYFQSTWGGPEGEGIYQCEIDPVTGAKLADSRRIWQGTGGAYPEAPHLYKIHGLYYLMIAEGGTEYGHMVTIARSEDPYGPFESCPHNPILSNRSMKSSIHATGHADLVQTQDGSWWAVCLGIRPVGYPMRHHLGREVYLAPVVWTEEGWPVLGAEGRILPVMDAPRLTETRWPEPAVRDDFEADAPGFDWTFLRNLQPESWSLREHPGYMTLHGNRTTLDDESGSPAFVGRRLRHFSCRASAHLYFDPMIEGEEAGLTVYMNRRYHYDLAVRMIGGVKKGVFRRTVGTMRTEETFDLGTASLVLRVEARPEAFAFSIQQEGTEAVTVGSGETHLLSTEVAGGFTGIFLAMYATCGAGISTPALFDWFDYEVVE